MAKPQHPERNSAPETRDLPEGWALVSLGELIAPSSRKAEPSQYPKAKYLGLEHIEAESGHIIGVGTSSDVKSTKALFQAGDVLYGKLRPYLNKVAVPDFAGICSTDILVFPPREAIHNGYLRRLLSAHEFVEYANQRASGIQLPRVNFAAVQDYPVVLPPLAEQKRIVAKIDALLARVGAARERLAKVPKLLKRFRQSVLAAACSGRLTSDWRESHSGAGTAAALLSSIRRERGVDDAEITNPAKPEIQIPDAWCWVSMGELLSGIEAGKNFSCIERPPRKGEVGVVKVSAVSWGEFDELESKTCPDPKLVNPKHFINAGDLLFSRANTVELVGACVIASEASRPLMLSDKILRLKLLGGIDRWVLYWLRSKAGRDQIEALATGNQQSMRNIGQDRIRCIAIGLPPLDEQREIVRRVEALFKLADAIEQRVASATARAEKLTQSILAKAFRGELVPTEAELARREGRSYESASELLQKVQAAESATTNGRIKLPSRRRAHPVGRAANSEA